MRGDLEHPPTETASDRAESCALFPQCVDSPLEHTLDLFGRGVGGEVDVGGVALASGEQVTHDPPDEIHPVARSGEGLGQWPDLAHHPIERPSIECGVVHQRSPCCACTAAMTSSARVPDDAASPGTLTPANAPTVAATLAARLSR